MVVSPNSCFFFIKVYRIGTDCLGHHQMVETPVPGKALQMQTVCLPKPAKLVQLPRCSYFGQTAKPACRRTNEQDQSRKQSIKQQEGKFGHITFMEHVWFCLLVCQHIDLFPKTHWQSHPAVDSTLLHMLWVPPPIWKQTHLLALLGAKQPMFHLPPRTFKLGTGGSFRFSSPLFWCFFF